MRNISNACDLLERYVEIGLGGYTLYWCPKYSTEDEIDCDSCELSYPHWRVGGFCSRCGYDITDDLDWGEEAPDMCPNCGAKMR